MLRLLAITLLLNSLVEAASSEDRVAEFLKSKYITNPKIKSINVKILNKVPVKDNNKWTAYFVELDAMLKQDKRQVVQKMIWFSDGEMITKELYDFKSGKDMQDSVMLPFKDEYYKKENLIYGNANAKHKVAIFSDPLCPFCRSFVPEAIEYMKKYPNKYAVYYYHFPLPSLHPAAVELVNAAVALELKGRKNVVLDLYKVEVDPKEKSVEKILGAFNKVMNSDIRMYDIMQPDVIKHIKSDLLIADSLMVQGTPTIFFDGVIDKTKNKYKKVK